MRAVLIYPHQLFADHPALRDADVCVLIEEPLLMTQYRFHRQKLILHRASMQHFAAQLRRQKLPVHYVECGELDATGEIAGVLTRLGVRHAQFVDPCDDWLQQRLTAALTATRIDFRMFDDPHFLTPWPIFDEFAAGRQRLFFTDFYVRQRKRLGETLSKHLRSRQETGETLRKHHPQVIEFRASIVIGSGSLSFEMIRALVERLPVMICPRWVRVMAQPIAVEDLLAYLLEALDVPDGPSQIYEIGGPDQVSYGEIMHEYARQRGLRRWMIPVPVLTPYLSSLWLGLVTPLYARVGRKLVESLRNPTLVSNDLAARTFSVRPRSVRDALARALVNEDRELAETRWSDALSAGGLPRTWGGVRFGSRLVDSRTATVDVPPDQAFAPIRRIGGRTGWYYGDWLWSLRGFLDLLCGGVGVRRGRRDPENLRAGDALDFWRVELYEPPHRLRLCAEMKLPGRAWLEFEVTGNEKGSTIRQTAIFDPIGLLGLLYWYGISPLHQFVFAGMLRNLACAAQSEQAVSRREG